MAAKKKSVSEPPASQAKVPSIPPVVEQVLLEGTFTVEKFIESFPVLVEAAEGTDKLRELVLELGIRGQLVPTFGCPKEPGLLAAIATAQRTAVASREIDAPPHAAPIGEDEYPHSLPQGWIWARLSQASLVVQIGPFGSLLHQADYVTGGAPLVNPANIKSGGIVPDPKKTVSEATLRRLRNYVLRTGDVVMGRRGEMGKCAVVGTTENGWLCGTGSLYVRLTSHVVPDFIALWLRSPAVRFRLEGESVGSTMNNLNLRILNSLVLALPPTSEQKRVVERVDQLMALIDDLEAKQNRKREVGARFTKASLDALTTAEGPEEFEAAWKRVVENWETVIDRPEKVGEVRKAIIELGVTGSLSGSHFKKEWQAVELGLVANMRTGYAFKSQDYVGEGVFVLRVTNIHPDSTINRNDAVFMPVEKIDTKLQQHYLREGEILLVMVGGSLGKLGIVSAEILPALLNQNMWRIAGDPTRIHQTYLFRLLQHVILHLEHVTHSTHGHLTMPEFSKHIVRLPPLAEQKRIVAKVDQLMNLCDQLEAALRRSEDRASKLVEAVVQEMVA